MARYELPTYCDLSGSSLRWAIDQLASVAATSPVTLIVHPYAKQLAEYIVYRAGWRIIVEIDDTLTGDDWIVRGENGATIHGGGA